MRERRFGLPTTAVTVKVSVTVRSFRWGGCGGTPLEGVLEQGSAPVGDRPRSGRVEVRGVGSGPRGAGPDYGIRGRQRALAARIWSISRRRVSRPAVVMRTTLPVFL
ncbi:hypothetical protein GCM10009830_42690 [Glycomyces endophyticus]|uniref:Uncharacterized protein n=1 Tax=Glycomyces endophyticus TaxID=480996 RepID=A0ABP4TLW5_9ACTN